MATDILTGIQSYFNGSQVQVAQAQLDDARRQFLDAGPKISTRVSVNFINPDPARSYYLGEDGPRDVTRRDAAGPDNLFLRVSVTNTGRSATSVRTVSVPTSSTFELAAGRLQLNSYVISCRKQGSETYVDCANFLPTRLDQGDSLELSFPMKGLVDIMARTGAARDGILVKVDAPAVQAAPIQHRSTLAVLP